MQVQQRDNTLPAGMQEKIRNEIIEIFTSEKSKLFSDLDQTFDQWENSFDKYEETFDIKFSDIADRFRIKSHCLRKPGKM